MSRLVGRMRRVPGSATTNGVQSATSCNQEDGFTLVELLIVLIVMPLLVGAVALAVITGLKATSTGDPHGTAARLADSHDAQITSAAFVQDVQSAQLVSTSAHSLCPSGGTGQVLGLQWTDSTGATIDVTYGLPTASSTAPALVRRFCSGSSAEVDSTVSHDVFSCPQAQPKCTPTVTLASGAACGPGVSSCALNSGVADVAAVVTCLDGTLTCAQAGPVSVTGTPGVKSIQLKVLEDQSGYQYTLNGTPRAWDSAGTPAGGTKPQAPLVLVSEPGTLPSISISGHCGFLVNGVVGVNNPNAGSISLGNGSLSATGIYTTDTANPSQSVNGSAGSYPTPVVAGAPVADPYASLTPPSIPAHPPTYPTADTTSNPGFHTYVVPTNWSPSGTLAPGIYIVPNGMSIGGGVTSTNGSPGGVLLYVTGGSIDLSGKGNVNLNPLSSPAFETSVQPEPAIWVASSDINATISLGGNGNATTVGAIYAPTASVSLSGGGNSGGIDTGQLVANSISCNGGGAQSVNLTVGSKLVSGTFGAPSKVAITNGASNQAVVTVVGAGALAPTGSVSVYVCGPYPSPASCTLQTNLVGTVSLVTGTAGTSTATSPSYTPGSPGTWCFAATYGGDASYSASTDTSADGCFTVAGPPSPQIAVPTAGCYQSKPKGNCKGTWPGLISGTATDAGGPGLASVQVSIQDPKGKWWNGTSFASATAIFVPATMVPPTGAPVTATWSLAFPIANFPSNDTGNYQIQATATDTSAVTSLPSNTVTITWNG